MKTILSIFTSLLLVSCQTESQSPPQNNGGGANGGNNGNTNGWLIPQAEVFDGGPGKDGIPALTDPEVKNVDEVDFLKDDDLVIGFSHANGYRAYPHKVLDWHEIINDNLNGKKVAITYCPLTGTGIAWNRVLDGVETTFGVSGLLYNTNLIPYDRQSGSNWCQISLKCVNGDFIGEEVETFKVLETTWETWKELYPNSTVVTTNTGYYSNYDRYPYGDYKTNNAALLFPISKSDTRLPFKKRVLAVIDGSKATAYTFESFEGDTKVIYGEINDKDIVLIGNNDKQFMVAFENKLNNDKRTFSISTADKQMTLKDDIGNTYDLFGNVTIGPNLGESLPTIPSFMAYWFSVGTFYNNPIIR